MPIELAWVDTDAEHYFYQFIRCQDLSCGLNEHPISSEWINDQEANDAE